MTMTLKETMGLSAICVLLIAGAASAHATMQSEDTSSTSKHEYRDQGQESSGQGDPSSDWKKITGTVKKTKHVGLRNSDQENLLVQLKTSQGRRIVDLGNAEKLEDVGIQKGDHISVWGKVKTIGDREVFMARKLKVNGEKIFIDRRASSPQYSRGPQMTRRGGEDQRQQTSDGQNRITGEVVAAGQVTEYRGLGPVMAFDRDTFYVVEDQKGQQSHVIVSEYLDPGFTVGDRIQAQVKSDGTVTSISRMAEESSGRSESGQAQNKQKEEGRSGDQQTARSAERED